MTHPKKATQLGLGAVILLGLNGILGSGIFLLPGKMYKLSGNFSLVLILLAALATLTIALCFADMASRVSGNGAAWLYTYHAFGRFPGFIIGFLAWIQGIITIAAEIAALLNTLQFFMPSLKQTLPYNLLGTVLIIVLAVINLAGDKLSGLADNISSVAKLLVLGAFILIGIWVMKGSNFVQTSHYNFGNYSQAFNIIFYMFAGFSFLPIAASDMANAKRNLPIAMIVVTVLVAVIYGAAQLVVIGLLGPNIINGTTPVAAAFATVLGQSGQLVILLGMLVSILGVAISVSFSTPFVASSLANEEQLLPAIIGKKTKNGTPWMSILLTTLASIALLFSGDYLFLTSCVVIIAIIQYLATALATIKSQRDTDARDDGWQLPLGPVIPILAIAFSIYILAGAPLKTWAFGGISIVIGLVLYVVDQQIFRKGEQHAPR
ncbi:APC family permease [Furfurilactobacillus curtus]|uniref:Amino acid transporter n=1 Tax=Furfurilactobacillus curtus TaxID=1746200 RepID=A0ABQ5JU68_9LACO